MNAEPFPADPARPLVAHADDGTPLKDGQGWTCTACGRLFAEKQPADACCIDPDVFKQTANYTPPFAE